MLKLKHTYSLILVGLFLPILSNCSNTNTEADKYDDCKALTEYYDTVIDTNEMDYVIAEIVSKCVSSGELVGLTKEEISSILGSGMDCKSYFTFQNFDENCVYYPVGTLPDGWVGGVPNLVLGFNEDGVCERMMQIHTQ